MANYKVVDADQLDAAMSATADSIRAKTGGTDPVVWDLDNGFQAAVEGIQTGGGGGDIPSAETAEFGRLKVVSNTAPAGKSWFNGVLLPDIPADVLAQYPYAWIRNNTRTGHYDLCLSSSLWYASDAKTISTDSYSTTGIQWYRITKSTPEEAWVFNQAWTSSGGFGNESDRNAVWSNHDIPNGSATATDIYFEGTEPTKELGVDYGDFVSGSEIYAVTIGAINDIAHKMQKLYSSYDLITGSEIRDNLRRCELFEKSTATTILDVSGLNFTSVASA